MCGVCGLYNYRLDAPVSKAILRSMTETIIHRGPDDEGFYQNGAFGMGMRRLSIIDVSGGHQPVHNEDQTLWIVFNGEIYNFRELRQELEVKGHVFYTRTDTEVIVHAYEEWGDDCVLRLNGIFGFSLWDQRRQRLLLARDHFGVKPLYYYDDGQRIAWGSEIKAILAASDFTKTVDIDALELFLTFRFVPSPFTLFKGVRKLPPGHRLILENGESRDERYWTPVPEFAKNLSEQDYIDLLQQKLEAAVERQMISDVPIGLLLSGGIDSGAVLAIMSKLTSLPVRTFTVGFKDGADVNELEEARLTAKLFGAEHYEVVLDRVNYQEWFAKAIWHLEEPISTTSALPMYFVSQLARQHVTVVLTGQGADEPHAGYHRYLGERYGELYRQVPIFLREKVLRPCVESFPRQERIKRAVRSLGIEDVTQRFAEVYAVFSPEMKSVLWKPEFQDQARDRQILETIRYWRKNIEHLNPLVQMAYVDARLSLTDDLLMYGDKMSMATSIEARIPFLDLDYMAVVEALPASLRIRGLTRKYIHKKAVAKWLPPEIIHRRKRGFETPMDRWFRTELSGYVQEMLLASDSSSLIYFDRKAISALLQDHISGRQNNRRQIFSLLAFESWHRQFID